MNDEDIRRLTRLLEDIRDNQKLQLERHGDALALQREQLSLVQRQAERYDRIQDRAEYIQDRSAQLVAGARKALSVVLPIIIVLIGYLSWLIFR
jgi:hypothetical protein